MNTSKIYLLLGMFIAAASSASAQDSYDAQTLSQSDLNGTSRFVGMGGALGALGGDISVMGTNPAGTGLYRKSDAAFTISGVFAVRWDMMDHVCLSIRVAFWLLLTWIILLDKVFSMLTLV